MPEYVVGFAIDEHQRVLLIRKKRPDYQAGKLNGVGGKIEWGETPTGAMRREFLEETTIQTWLLWQHLLSLRQFGDGDVHFFVTRQLSGHCLEDAVKANREIVANDPEVEELELHEIAMLVHMIHHKDPAFYPLHNQLAQRGFMPNLSWIIPLAAYTHDSYMPFRLIERGS